jgi:rod shape-determining protein MreC
MLVGLILLFAPQSLTNDLQFAFARLFRWPLTIGKNISLYTRARQPTTDTKFEGESQYRNYIANLEAELREKQRILEKLTKLKNRFHALENASLIMADIITYTMNGTQNELTINRGQNDGLAKGQFVLGDNSIIGTINDVNPRTSNVRLFTDPASKIAVRIGNLNVDRLMQGRGNDVAKVLLLPTKYKVKAGDKVMARKTPGFLDAPMIIGTVSRCKRDDQRPSIWDITVKPVCEIEILKSVTIIIMNPQG